MMGLPTGGAVAAFSESLRNEEHGTYLSIEVHTFRFLNSSRTPQHSPPLGVFQRLEHLGHAVRISIGRHVAGRRDQVHHHEQAAVAHQSQAKHLAVELGLVFIRVAEEGSLSCDKYTRERVNKL